jgi:tetratricopeptide (TPR) repeat protein
MMTAINDYSEAIGLDPGNAVAFFGRGVGYAKMGQYDRAILEFDEAIRLNPNLSLASEYRAAAFKWYRLPASKAMPTLRPILPWGSRW